MKKVLISLYVTVLMVTLGGLAKAELVGGRLANQLPHERSTGVGGPFESSGSTSRFALVESINLSQKFILNSDLAKFASPDVVETDKGFVSIFTPGVAFLSTPLYWLGSHFGAPQLVSYFLGMVMALISFVALVLLATRLGLSLYAGVLAGLAFVLATNFLPYSATLTQHPTTSALLLLSLWLLTFKSSLITNLLLGIIFGLALLVDIPNVFLMIPIGLAALVKAIDIKARIASYQIRVNVSLVILALGLLPAVFAFGFYNLATTGAPTLIAQNIGRVTSLDESGQSVSATPNSGEKFDKKLPLDTRSQLQGLYILLVSNQRGIFYYSPILVIGTLGLWQLKKRKSKDFLVTEAIIGAVLFNLATYSMFGDPWGGWSFGPRYLIPAAACLSLGVAAFFDYARHKWQTLLLILLLPVSAAINLLGALTSTNVPPKVEAIQLPEPIPYTYKYNWQLLTESDSSKTLLYQVTGSRIAPTYYFLIYLAWLSLILLSPVALKAYINRRSK